MGERLRREGEIFNMPSACSGCCAASASPSTLESVFCVDALDAALALSESAGFHPDQGAPRTSEVFTGSLKQRQIFISTDGVGRALDDAFIERL